MPVKTLGSLMGKRLRTGGLVSVLALMAAVPALGQETRDCRLVDGVLPDGCATAGEGQAVQDPVTSNVELEEFPGSPKGFSISVDGETLAGEDRKVIAGAASPGGALREQDLALDAADVQVRYDGTRAERRLNVLTSDLRTEFSAGEEVSFNASTSYERWIDRAELRITPVRRGFGRPETIVVPMDPNGSASWTVPAGDENDFTYVLRVYDSAGRYDETAPEFIGRRERLSNRI
ncbi:MAG: hypothetical protein HC844_07455 [Tabrizicola sp.]|nr:hypothetical protein [Tabrizicola sp.]